MNLPKNYSKEMFENDLKHGNSFSFQLKLWVQLLFSLGFIIMFLIGFIFLLLLDLFFLIIALIFITGGVIGLLFWLFLVTKKVIVSKEGIKWKSGLGTKKLNFMDFDEIEYYNSIFTNLETVKITDKNFRMHRIRISLMTAPKKWYSEELIRSAIDYYWRKVNPDAKYAKKTVQSSPLASKKPGSISLLKPGSGSTVPQTGYKCPNCLVVHEQKQRFCPKCGARMD